MSEYKQLTITVPNRLLKEFREFCSSKQIPFSRFLSVSGATFIDIWEDKNSKKCSSTQQGDCNGS